MTENTENKKQTFGDLGQTKRGKEKMNRQHIYKRTEGINT